MTQATAHEQVYLVIGEKVYTLENGELVWNNLGWTEPGWSRKLPESFERYSPAEIVPAGEMARRALIKAALETAEVSQL